MAGVTYEVVTLYKTLDQGASAGAARVASAHDKAAASTLKLGSVADAAKNAIDGLAQKMAMLGTVAIGGGLAAVVMGLKTGLDASVKMEDSTLAMASTFRMLGAVDSFGQGLGAAKQLIEGIRQDAAALPGEFQDFVSMSQNLTPAMLNAGKGLEDIRTMTRDTVVAAASLGVEFQQAGREMAELIEGRAGVQNKLGMRLGIGTHTMVNGKAFNAATAAERTDFLQSALGNAKDALPAFQKSWSGLTSTMRDNVRQLLGRATSGVFVRAKEELQRINDLLGSGGMQSIADRVNHALVVAFDHAVHAVEWIGAHWKQIEHGARQFGEEMVAAFHRVEPIAARIARTLTQHGGGIATGVVAARAGIAAAPVLQAVGGAATAIGGTALAGALAAAAGALDLLTAKAGELPEVLDVWSTMAKGMWAEAGKAFGDTWENIKSIAKDLWDVLRPLVDLIGLVVIGAIDGLAQALRFLSGGFKSFVAWLKSIMPEKFSPRDEDTGNDDFVLDDTRKKGKKIKALDAEAKKANEASIAAEIARQQKMQDQFAASLKAQKTTMPGAGKMNVTVNAPLTVLSDADPERLAKGVATVVKSELRNATSAHSMWAHGRD